LLRGLVQFVSKRGVELMVCLADVDLLDQLKALEATSYTAAALGQQGLPDADVATMDSHFEEVRFYLAGTRGSNNNPVVILASLWVPKVMEWAEEVESRAVAFVLGRSASFGDRLSTAAGAGFRAGMAAAHRALATSQNGNRGLANPRAQEALLATANGAARGIVSVQSVAFQRDRAW
jgi:hypothetical protein